MKNEDLPLPVFFSEIPVDKTAIDQNNHVNNVVYVQWMQDIAVRHSELTGGTRTMHLLNTSWVVRSHKVEYIYPAVINDTLIGFTWIADFRSFSCIRKYCFKRKSDNKMLVKGETEWVLVDAKTGRPVKVPDELRDCYPVVPATEEP